MKRTLLWFLLPAWLFFFSAKVLKAQVNLEDALLTDENSIVHSKGLPSEFLSFSTDTVVQIIFNPARGNRYNKNFLYFNYLPNVIERQIYFVHPYRYDNVFGYLSPYPYPYPYQVNFEERNPAFSVISFFGDENSKWFFSLRHNLTKGDNKSDRTYYLREEDEADDYIYQDENNFNNNLSENKSQTEIKIAKVGGDDQISYSIGGTALLSFDEFELLSESQSSHYRANFSSGMKTNSYSMIRESNEKRSTKFNKWLVGFEAGVSKVNDWDLKLRLAYAKYKTENESFDYFFSKYVDSSASSQTSSGERQSTSQIDYANDPYALIAEGFFRKRIGLFTDQDFFFASLEAFTSSVQYPFNLYSSSKNVFITPTSTNGDTSEFRVNEIFDSKNWRVAGSVGYVIKKEFDNLHFLSGLKFSAAYSKLDSIYDWSSSYIFGENENTIFFAQLPLFAEWYLSEFVSVWGGMNFFYTYSKSTAKDERYPFYYYYYYNTIEYNQSSINSINSTSTSNEFYLGAKFVHNSGVRVIISFDNSLADYKQWFVSLGYHF